jgi:prepilin-type N-terminal cleavage/methylation domain-containing protein
MNRSKTVFSRNDEAGFTIVEVMVAVVMLAIVLAVMYKGMDSISASAAGTEERLVNLEEARVMMATVTKDLRTAARPDPNSAPFELANSRELTFYANLGSTSGPSKVHIFVDAENRIIEEVTQPDAGSAPNYTYTGAPSVRAVGSYVVPGTQIFTYQYFNETTSAFVALNTLPLSADDRKLVESIEVRISIRKSSTAATPATTLVNRVRLPNVYYTPINQGQG